MEQKTCTNCREEFPKTLEFFGKGTRGEFHCYCRKCKSLKQKEYYKLNSQKIKDYQKKYNSENSDKVKSLHDLYYVMNKEKVKTKVRAYREKNKGELAQKKQDYYYNIYKERKAQYDKRYYKNVRKNDAMFKLKQSIRHRMYLALRGFSKSESTFKLLGCNLEQFKDHLESKFTPGMTWENYGEWHVDHIIPLSYYNLKKMKNQKEAFHYTNTQPLWRKENMFKGNIHNGVRHFHKKPYLKL